jgi:hypothetical protein
VDAEDRLQDYNCDRWNRTEEMRRLMMKHRVLMLSVIAMTSITAPAIAATENIYLVSQQASTNQISGEVISIDDDDFILNTGTRQIKV